MLTLRCISLELGGPLSIGGGTYSAIPSSTAAPPGTAQLATSASIIRCRLALPGAMPLPGAAAGDLAQSTYVNRGPASAAVLVLTHDTETAQLAAPPHGRTVSANRLRSSPSTTSSRLRLRLRRLRRDRDGTRSGSAFP